MTLARAPRETPAESVISAPVPGVATMISEVRRKATLIPGRLPIAAYPYPTQCPSSPRHASDHLGPAAIPCQRGSPDWSPRRDCFQPKRARRSVCPLPCRLPGMDGYRRNSVRNDTDDAAEPSYQSPITGGRRFPPPSFSCVMQ
jgi:hypothetical protein